MTDESYNEFQKQKIKLWEAKYYKSLLFFSTSFQNFFESNCPADELVGDELS